MASDIIDRFRAMQSGISTAGAWCLVRWMSGITRMVLLARGGNDAKLGGVVDQSGASFCGPLSIAADKYFSSGGALGVLGFPRGEIGDVMLFSSETEASEAAELRGDHIAIDLPCPLTELEFSVRVYNHYDGKTEFLYQGRDLAQARILRLAFQGYAAEQVGGQTLKVTLDCSPCASLSHRPSLDQARRLNERHLSLRDDSEGARAFEAWERAHGSAPLNPSAAKAG